MKLYLNAASPYARLVRAVVVETDLQSETELCYVDPWETPAELVSRNPAAKVPALELDDGTCLVESACICDYLIETAGRRDLAPLLADDAALRLHVLGLGRAAIDCSFGAVLMARSSASHALATRWTSALPRIAESLEKVISSGNARTAVDLADLTIAVAFEYIDFRHPDVSWRETNARLARRIDSLGERASLATTRPK